MRRRIEFKPRPFDEDIGGVEQRTKTGHPNSVSTMLIGINLKFTQKICEITNDNKNTKPKVTEIAI